MRFQQEVISRLDKLTDQQQKHTIELALNTKVLNEHHVRASQIEARVVPLERSHIFFNQLAKSVTALLVAGAALASIWHYIKS